MQARLPAPIRAEAAIVTASALADLGRLDEGLRVLSAFPVGRDVGRDHEVRLWYVQADLLERSARHPEAITVFRRILRVEPDAFDVAERVAALEMRAGDGERGSRRQSTGRGGRAGPFVT